MTFAMLTFMALRCMTWAKSTTACLFCPPRSQRIPATGTCCRLSWSTLGKAATLQRLHSTNSACVLVRNRAHPEPVLFQQAAQSCTSLQDGVKCIRNAIFAAYTGCGAFAHRPGGCMASNELDGHVHWKWPLFRARSEPRPGPRVFGARVLCAAALTGAGYYFGAKLGLAPPCEPQPISVLWPPNSILLAALLLVPA